MNKKIATYGLAMTLLLQVMPFAVAGLSTVDPTIPAANSAIQSAPVRSNFAAAANDINGLIQQNSGPTAPASPVLGQAWINTTSSPYIWNIYDGVAWDELAPINPSTNKIVIQPAQGGTGLASPGTVGNVLVSTGLGWASQAPTNTGTVTSAGLILPSSIFNVTGSPITTSGTFAASLQTQSVNTFFAGPSSGGSAQPTFRAIAAADVPTLNQNTTGTAANVTGTVLAAHGGTGLTTCSTNGYVLTWNTGSSTWTCAAPTAGGTVTSVGLSLPISVFSLSGTPVTGSGTLTATLNTEPAGYVWAGPTTGNAVPSFRSLVGSDLPAPGASTLGGVESGTAGTNQFMTGISTGGAPTFAQPAFSNLSGSAACSQEPARTGDVTSSAGSCANTLATVNSNVGTYSNATVTVNGKGQVTAASNGTVPLSVVNGFINGFALSNDGTSPNSVIDVAAGYASDSANAVMITGTTWTKSTAGTFAAGSGGNGMGSSLTITASTWYHVLAIVCSGSYDVYFDTSLTAANKPACATAYRYIGDILTDASAHILAFTQRGQKIRWSTNYTDLSSGTATGATAITVHTPTGVVVFPILNLLVSQTAIATSDGAFVMGASGTSPTDCEVVASVTSVQVASYCQTVSNASSQIFYENGASTTSLTVQTEGYINPSLAPNQ